jgi:MFS transporter, DHA1 family, multidrug resistance protein
VTEATRPGELPSAGAGRTGAGSQRDIYVLCLGSLLFSMSFQLLTTVLPLRALDLRATGLEIGLITGAFAGASLLARPIVGWQLDRGRRLPLLLLGAGIFALSSFGYTLVVTVLLLLADRKSVV